MGDSNWKNLKGKIATVKSSNIDGKNVLKRKRTELIEAASKSKSVHVHESTNPGGKFVDNLSDDIKGKYVGLDCEMVGIGPDGKQSALARACVVDFNGNVLYDRFVRPPGFVTDFRTKYSGVRKQDLRLGHAVSLQECQKEVATLLSGKILVGHALRNDLDVLMLGHPRTMIRDTSSYRPFMRPHGSKMRPRALRDLSKQHLGMTIQTGEHDPGEDARAAVFLYRTVMREWEKELKQRKSARMKPAARTGSSNEAEHVIISSVNEKSDIADSEHSEGQILESDNDADDVKRDSQATQFSKKKRTKLSGEESSNSTSAVDKHKRNGSFVRRSGTGMFSSCSVDEQGRALRSISDVDSRHLPGTRELKSNKANSKIRPHSSLSRR